MFSDVEFLDAALVDRYRAPAQASIARYGGRYIVRGGTVEPLEGGWVPENIASSKFPTMQQAEDWYHSPAYAEALKLRDRALKRRLIVVEGAPPT